MARKWLNLNIPGALHYVTGNLLNRQQVFTDPNCCKAFLDELRKLNQEWPSKLITYVLMPDHFHLIVNPRDGCIREYCGYLKAVAAKAILKQKTRFVFPKRKVGRQVWQESLEFRFMEWVHDLAEDQLHPQQSSESKIGEIGYWSGFRSFYHMGDEPLAVDHDWWWPEDAEKLSKHMKARGWYGYHKRKKDED
jgi:REP element-mobilizing transposase RayT